MLSIPHDPGPQADFYTTIRYLQSMATFLGHDAIVSAFNMKAHMTQSDQLTVDVAANLAATNEIATNLAALSSEVTVAVANLAAEIKLAGTPPANISQALTDLEAINAKLTGAAAEVKAETEILVASDATVPPKP